MMPVAKGQTRGLRQLAPAIVAVLFLGFFCAVGLATGRDATGLVLWLAVFAAGVAIAAASATLARLADRAAGRYPARAKACGIVSATLLAGAGLGALAALVGFVVMVWQFGMLVFPIMFGG
jgi:hypothetical protein